MKGTCVGRKECGGRAGGEQGGMRHIGRRKTRVCDEEQAEEDVIGEE